LGPLGKLREGNVPYCKCNNLDIYYEVGGNGNPLLFINGLSSDISKKESFLNELKKYFRVIAFDMRSVGRSQFPKEDFTIADNADDVYELLEYLDIKKTNVCGFSMGGAVAATMALKYPERVDKLILMSTMPAWGKPYPFSEWSMEVFHNTNVTEKLLKDVYELTYGAKYREKNSADEYVKAAMNPKYPQTGSAYLQQLGACEAFDELDNFPNIKHETLILTGDSDKLVDPRTSEWMNDHLENSKLIVYEGLGHMVTDEVPKKAASDISEFINGT
jgi:3-oxoadipate enol-lactonase